MASTSGSSQRTTHQRNIIVNKNLAKGIKISNSDSLLFCEGCVEGKMQRKSLKTLGEIRSSRRLELVHSDVCGPNPLVEKGISLMIFLVAAGCTI